MRILTTHIIAVMLLLPSVSVLADSNTMKSAQQKNQRQVSNHQSKSQHKVASSHHSVQHKNQYVYNRAYYNNRYNQRYNSRYGYHSGYGSRVGWSIGIGSGWNNGWYPYGGYYGSRWGYPWGRAGYYGASAFPLFGWSRPLVRPSQPKVIAPPQQITTSVQYSQGLTRLPDNAKVIQTSTGTQYEWQGILYRYDWQTQTYQTVNTKE
ncbi:hypothetical protein [uncultured Shewanella sp.]|uniref:hypothetical protein n=1 Tax=uncultured Shewanella sp. TaxID=173975 RepID=UPI002609E2CB|nr:hypothetical protein [uncultured Shewanella sp.]